MNIDVNTIEVLKNFAKINPSILIQEGNVVKTISTSKTIMAKATVPTYFEKRFAVYNLDQFISVMSLFDKPELNFKDTHVDIVEEGGKSRQSYVYSDENTVTKVPDKEISLPSVDVSFTLTNEVLKRVERAAGVNSLPEIIIKGSDGKINVQTADTKNPSSHVYSVEVGETNLNFKVIFKFENIRIIPGDYDVDISSRGISHFKGKDVEYWIAVESTSTF